MNPNHLKLLKKAQTLELAGKALEASMAYRAFLELEPKHADAWASYVGQLLKLGQTEEARKACDTALTIELLHLSAKTNLGRALMRLDRLDECERHLRAVLELDPNRMDTQLLLAECLLNQRDMVNARKVLDGTNRPGAMVGKFARLQPRQAELWAIFSLGLSEAQNFREAIEACNIAIRIDPHNFTARSNLGSIWMAQGNLEQAESLFRQLLVEHPRKEIIRLLLITCLTRKADLIRLDLEVGKAIQQGPDNFLVHQSVLGTFYNLGRWTDYKAEIERFRMVDPASAHSDWEQGEIDLLFGNMREGWERYEARLKLPVEGRSQQTTDRPAWNGEPFTGKTLLLWAEQGLGDALMFMRYLPLVKAVGGRVILETWPALMGIAATCEGADIVVSKGAPLPPFDLQASLLSLPWIFRTDLSSIPAMVPYLNVPEEIPNRKALLERLAGTQGYTRIGLVWAGRPEHGRDFERSLPASALAPLAALSEVAWFSFQLGRPEVPALPNLFSLAPFLSDFSDTAYALSGMDLLITVDTSVAHLAGALGIPTLLLLPFQPDFRWMLGRDDSPWYPTLRLYRQPAYGDWDSVIRQVVSDLTQES